MSTGPQSKLPTRKLKTEVHDLLRNADFDAAMDRICQYPYRQVVNPLFGFLHSLDETVRWRAISAMGAVVCRLADQSTESARIVMRRFLWNLNDESGGIGWGSPEAMGEIMARSAALAGEYANLLVSYIEPGKNFLEHEELQKGLLWALGRLARSRPSLVARAAAFLPPFLQSADRRLRGLSIWAAVALPLDRTEELIRKRIDDNDAVTIYLEGRFITHRIGQLAQNALRRTPSDDRRR
jgi:hypothetical protein